MRSGTNETVCDLIVIECELAYDPLRSLFIEIFATAISSNSSALTPISQRWVFLDPFVFIDAHQFL
jgi:hypothetical protein